jgi:alanine racemase
MEIVEMVIGAAYGHLNKMAKIHNELEISGFGVLKVSQAKLTKRIAKLDRIILLLQKQVAEANSDENRQVAERKLGQCIAEREYFKTKERYGK